MKDAAQSSASISRQEGRQHGFSLIEVLVSLALSAVILALLGRTVYSFSEGWSRQSALIEQQDMIRRGLGVLRRDLRSLQRVIQPGVAPPQLAFKADRSSLRFVSLAPGYPTESGAVFVKYTIEKRGGTRELIRRVARYRSNISPAAVAYRNAVEIVSGYPDLRFSFQARQSGGQKWQSDWAAPDALPGLVRLRFLSRGVTAYPSAIIAIRAHADQACVAGLAKPCTISTDRRSR